MLASSSKIVIKSTASKTYPGRLRQQPARSRTWKHAQSREDALTSRPVNRFWVPGLVAARPATPLANHPSEALQRSNQSFRGIRGQAMRPHEPRPWSEGQALLGKVHPKVPLVRKNPVSVRKNPGRLGKTPVPGRGPVATGT